MLVSRYPYRRSVPSLARPETVDPLRFTAAAVRVFVLGWSLTRDLACIEGGFDFEGFLAATIIALSLLFRTRSLLP